MNKLEFVLILASILVNVEVILCSPPPRQNRIIGGVRSMIEDFPYQVSLMLYGEHFCGGSIIHADWVLTAAHCVEETFASELTIRVGSSDSYKGGVVYKISQIVMHPNYNEETVDYDYALLKVATPFKFNSKIAPIELAGERDHLFAGTVMILSGWGTTEKVEIAEVLNSATVPYISQKNCKKYYVGEITDRMFCAGLSKGGRDACQGDSGGPIVAYGLQYGIVSWGNGCGEANQPGVYASIPNQRAWIKSVTGV